MIHHHGSGIEMARLAAQKSERAEVSALAKKIASSQGKERGQMTAWLKSWLKAQTQHGESVGARSGRGRVGGGPRRSRWWLSSLIIVGDDGLMDIRLAWRRPTIVRKS
jgi:hypothetical protein